MYSAGCIICTSTRGLAALLTSFIEYYDPINLWACKPVCECECVQMPFQQGVWEGADPCGRWHFYWRNVTTAIFFPYVCARVCVCLCVGWRVCLIRSWQASIDFTGDAYYVPNTRISFSLGTTSSPSFVPFLLSKPQWLLLCKENRLYREFKNLISEFETGKGRKS